jgi:hypothetical protein
MTKITTAVASDKIRPINAAEIDAVSGAMAVGSIRTTGVWAGPDGTGGCIPVAGGIKGTRGWPF